MLKETDTKAKPWEQQPEEPSKAYQQFVLYRDMMHRSLAKLATLQGRKSVRSCEKLSHKYQWRNRVLAWDKEQDRRLRALQTSDIEEMNSRHVRLGIGMQSAVVKELQSLVNRVDEAAKAATKKAVEEGLDPAKAHHAPVLTVNELIRLSEHGINLERLARGEPTEKIDTGKGEGKDLSVLSLRDLKELRRLQKAVNGE